MKVQASSAAKYKVIDHLEAGPESSAHAQPLWTTPNVRFERRMFTDGLMTMPDGCDVRFWGFQDPVDVNASKSMCSPAIRIQEGAMVQVRLETEAVSATRNATSGQRNGGHWGGALAVQKTESFIYQWQPQSSGTWLYQSHLSSLAHFEMGLYGLMIVEPPATEAGRRLAYRGGPEFTVEKCWVLDDIDPSWHTGEAVEVDRPFNPSYFLVNGVPNTETLDHKDVVIDAWLGDKILIRMLNASFSLVRIQIEDLQGHVIAVDGKPLASSERPWTAWTPISRGKPFLMTTGARRDLLIDLDPMVNPVERGREYTVTFEFLDWEKRTVRNASAKNPVHLGVATTRIRVA